MNAFDLIVLFAYATLVLEMTVFPIPSEASVWQLLGASEAEAEGDGALASARRRPLATKLLFYMLPTVLGIGFFLVPLVCIFWSDARDHSHAQRVPALGWLGIALIIAGRAVTFASVLQLRAARAAGESSPRGLFRWSRNPGLCGMFTLYIGLCLVCALPWLWLGLPLYVVNMHRRVRMEEAGLLAHHGPQWRDYAARVPRYLPLPGLR